MRRIAGFAMVVALLAVLVPTHVTAQSIWFGGGGSFPVSDYSDYANTGFLLTTGVSVPVGQEGLSLFGEAFFGQNSHSDFPALPQVRLGLLRRVHGVRIGLWRWRWVAFPAGLGQRLGRGSGHERQHRRFEDVVRRTIGRSLHPVRRQLSNRFQQTVKAPRRHIPSRGFCALRS